MAAAGLQVLLLEKETFPRDKICGDAISGKSVDVLRRMNLIEEVMRAEQVGSWGVTFGGPYGDEAAIPFTQEQDRCSIPPGFICTREVFDDVLFQQVKGSRAEVRQNAKVTGLLFEDERVRGVHVQVGEETETIEAPLVIGADGAYSVVARELGMAQLNEKHYCAGLRSYYRGVTGFHEGNHVELHFVEEAIPGYFWIFPLPGGRANVGIGMLSQAVKKNNVKLKDLLETCIEHPRFRDRFAGAEREGAVKGWGLPLGSNPRSMAGDGWLLVGDAASLIDPFTGEGIGNAMVSGEKAARWASRAKAEGNYSTAFLKGFEQDVLNNMGGELRLSRMLQRLINWKTLLNTVISKAGRSDELADTISCMFDDESQRRRLVSPLFYLRVLTA